jgi:hypothetical protein
MFPQMSDEQVNTVIAAIRQFTKLNPAYRATREDYAATRTAAPSTSQVTIR